ncbi:MAG: response regulator [Lachnospiraceae bacterium]|nr:response regulator [Lachnospiraceae bacterium]MDY5741960.1 response regulator [Lachnospiraceae bacterium]
MYKVLLVDDEILIRDAMREIIHWEELGFELMGTASDGRQALDMIEVERPQLVLTDICMPYMDGLELARELHERYPSVKVMIITGHNEFSYAKRAMQYKVSEYIMKPITAGELSEVLLRAKAELDQLRHEQSSLKRIRGAYLSQLPALRSRILNKLVLGATVPDQINEKLLELDISLPGPYYCVAKLRVEERSNILQTVFRHEESLMLFAVWNVAQELMGEAGGVGFQDTEDETVLILGCDSEERLQQRLFEVAKRIGQALTNHLRILTTIGVGGTVEGLEALPQSFAQAGIAIGYGYTRGCGRIYCYDPDEAKRSSFSTRRFIQLMDQLEVQGRAGDAEKCKSCLDQAINAIATAFSAPDQIWMYLQSMLLRLFISILEHEGGTEEEEELQARILEEVSSAHTMEQAKRLCLEAVDLLMNLTGKDKEQQGRKQAVLALDYIERNYSDKELSLQSVCAYLAISPSYFSFIFKQNTGETFIEAVTRIRMQHARELLADTDLKTYEVAEQVGFADPHYFGIVFKKQVGMTPKAFAKQKREQK